MRLPKRPPFLTDGNEIAVEIADLCFEAMFLNKKKTILAEMAKLKRELDSVNRDLSFLSSKISTNDKSIGAALNEIDAAIAKFKQEAKRAGKKWQFSEEELHDHYEFICQSLTRWRLHKRMRKRGPKETPFDIEVLRLSEFKLPNASISRIMSRMESWANPYKERAKCKDDNEEIDDQEIARQIEKRVSKSRKKITRHSLSRPIYTPTTTKPHK